MKTKRKLTPSEALRIKTRLAHEKNFKEDLKATQQLFAMASESENVNRLSVRAGICWTTADNFLSGHTKLPGLRTTQALAAALGYKLVIAKDKTIRLKVRRSA